MEAADDQPLLKFLEDAFKKLSDLDDCESSQTALFFKKFIVGAADYSNRKHAKLSVID